MSEAAASPATPAPPQPKQPKPMQVGPKRYEDALEFDAYVAKYYVNKQKSCVDRGIDFKLSLTQVKNMLRAKKCPILGLDLTHTNAGMTVATGNQRKTDVTIDRLDCTLPYETGNVIALSYQANQIKNIIEMEVRGKTPAVIHTMSRILKKHGK